MQRKGSIFKEIFGSLTILAHSRTHISKNTHFGGSKLEKKMILSSSRFVRGVQGLCKQRVGCAKESILILCVAPKKRGLV